MVDLRRHLKKAVKKRWAEASKEEKAKEGARLSRAYWDGMTSEERSAEMKRRAAKRKKRSDA